ncbi:MAG: hypothetical protein ACR2JD_00800 [Nocardioides sp.]
MSGNQSFPPPGAGQPGPDGSPTSAPPPGAPPHAAALPGPHPGPSPGQFRGAAHKPGAIALRPLSLGDIYDAALKIIRFNPKATVGSAVLVTAIAMAIPVILTSILTFALDLSLDLEATAYSSTEIAGLVGSFGSLLLGVFLQSIGLVLVTGMIAHVVAAAAIGQRLGLGEAWARTRGKRWSLIGLTLLLFLITLLLIAGYAAAWIPVIAFGDGLAIALFALVTIPLFATLMFWFWIRVYYLPVPALMLEPIGVTGAIARGYRLTRGAFWRTFGIALLTVLLAQVAGSILALPISIAGQLGSAAGATSRYAVLILVLSQALSSVITAAFVAPFTTAVASVQYLDQRIRKEAYDVELMSQAGITGS